MELRFAVQHLSGINKESGFPVYDLGFDFNLAMARAMNVLRPALEKIDAAAKAHRDKVGEAGKDGAKAAAAIEAEWADSLAETIDADLSPIKSEKIQCRGMSPTPEILEMLSPLIRG